MAKGTCTNCGYDEGLHQWETMRCPKGGEAPVGKKQEWKQSRYEESTLEADEKIAQLKAQVKALQNIIDGQNELIESLSAMIEEEMGEWYGISYGHCPVRLSNLAHMRDAIEEFKEIA